ncbi:MAG: hypothetical protein ABSB40_12115 [Nitrososphaeria archaeon]
MIILKPTLMGDVGIAKTDTTNASDSEVARVVFYQNVDPRRKPELMDSELIREDHAKIANLPEEFIHSSGLFDKGY